MIRKHPWGLVALSLLFAYLAVTTPAHAQQYTRFGPANGILKGATTTPQTTAAVASDVVSLWTGTCNATTFLRADGSCQTAGGGGGGSVTSVALTMPTGLSVSGSPVTTSGTLTVTTALSGILKGNGSGFTAGLVALASEVSGTLPVANGGTGATSLTGVLKGNTTSAISSAASADVVALWSGTCNSGSFLRGDGTCVAAGAGSVTSVGLTVPAGLSVSGSPVTSSGTLAITTALSGPVRGTGTGLTTGATALASEVSGTLPVANGGTGVTTSTGTGSVVLSASPTFTGTVNASTVAATTLTGDGSGLTGLDAGDISAGTLAVARGGTGVTTSTGTGSVVLSASPTLTGTTTAGTVQASAITVGGNAVCQSNGTDCPTVALGSGVSGTLPVANGGTGVTTSTGSGAVVRQSSPTITGTMVASNIFVDQVNVALPSGLTVNGSAVCQVNGTNCPTGAALKTAYARIIFNSGCTLDRNVGIGSCSWSATGNGAFNMSAAGFTSNPVCTATPQPTSGITARAATVSVNSTTSSSLNMVSSNFATALDGEINVICVGT